MTTDTMLPSGVASGVAGDHKEILKHDLPVLKVTLPPDVDAEGDSYWKLDRRDSGSLFWRKDSVACKTSRVKFLHDVDVREFHPRPEERLSHSEDGAEAEEDDIYSDDYILRHDVEPSGWMRPSALRPANLFGYRRLRLPRKRVTGPDGTAPKESSVFMSLVCLVAILVTAWLQGSISPINL
ncbi:uncharacterized protein LOC117647108 [Thrips palmi]|uniref:Uncharacterized protein LOC117647108 n=1 Tax=Thrips palmi TaxID=161013 RepID=A0A6P8YWM1_THRPL|nr:uncharacterized protein LOC117647108 [Thrips palmi]